MAGKFLSPEEAARHLGVTVEDINRLVDRKKLFPMRDGATVKFKLDDIDRVAGDLADDDQPAASGGLDLELDLSSPGLGGGGGADDEILLGDAIEETESIFGSDIAVGGVSARTTSGDKAEPSGDDLVIGEGGGGLDSSDLEIDSIIGSSPALAQGASAPAGDSNVAGGSGTLAIDLSNLGSGPMAGGSVAGLSGSTPGAALSGALDSGLSLEGADLQASGVNLAGSGVALGGSGVDLGGSGIGSGIDAVGGGLGGDAFELGDIATDEESASVVIATEETGDSSFFGTVSEDSASVSLEDSAGMAAALAGDDAFLQAAAGPPFSGLQILGLVCCTLLLLTCGLVMIDLVWSIRAPAGSPVSSPLLKTLTDTFSWR
jgi:excisionase family DNA binding protein